MNYRDLKAIGSTVEVSDPHANFGAAVLNQAFKDARLHGPERSSARYFLLKDTRLLHFYCDLCGQDPAMIRTQAFNQFLRKRES
jgi:hypothetical protein